MSNMVQPTFHLRKSSSNLSSLHCNDYNDCRCTDPPLAAHGRTRKLSAWTHEEFLGEAQQEWRKIETGQSTVNDNEFRHLIFMIIIRSNWPLRKPIRYRYGSSCNL